MGIVFVSELIVLVFGVFFSRIRMCVWKSVFGEIDDILVYSI